MNTVLGAAAVALLSGAVAAQTYEGVFFGTSQNSMFVGPQRLLEPKYEIAGSETISIVKGKVSVTETSIARKCVDKCTGISTEWTPLVPVLPRNFVAFTGTVNGIKITGTTTPPFFPEQLTGSLKGLIIGGTVVGSTTQSSEDFHCPNGLSVCPGFGHGPPEGNVTSTAFVAGNSNTDKVLLAELKKVIAPGHGTTSAHPSPTMTVASLCDTAPAEFRSDCQ